MDDLSRLYNTILKEHISVIEAASVLQDDILFLAGKIIESFKSQGKLIIFGNGGSASDSQHFAAELTGRFKKVRRGLPAIALTTDTAVITSIGNDFSFNDIFARQIEALAFKNDVIIGFSTSGESENVIRAIQAAKRIGCFTAALTGKKGGRLKTVVDLPIIVPSDEIQRIQECHVLIYHILCEIIDNAFSV
jgi:D-sedoheptulose 7-phosphate isomerase